ncbi:DUF1349 domain-containing protein [Actinoplanes digitatis]|uniref:DUF1349 domain-containing protein n=1 Tax=Actinoplanes digitatis TaxID=1868 RepID=UPI00161C9F95|nr:DUF1349 domain-containing protein [Actinoplanes digitatis]
MPELPFPLSWSPAPQSWPTSEDGSVRAEAPLLLGSYRGDFQFSALVAPAFGAAFDAGALIVREGPDRWLKLAFEAPPEGVPMVVSVVTRGSSDDANGA